MKRHLVGHRGVGKTDLLNRHSRIYKTVKHFDLDEEIKKHLSTSITNFFEIKGENEFREIEKTVYQKIIKENSEYVIAVGAGFDIKNIAASDEIIYISRQTDKDGRVFLNRPRLNSELDPMTEYSVRYNQREPNFIKFANRIYQMPEGLQKNSEIEQKILKKEFYIKKAIYTVSASEIVEISHLMKCFYSLELRSDLLPATLIEKLTLQFPKYNWIVSIRNEKVPTLTSQHWIDWDIDLKIQPKVFVDSKNKIYSSHAENILEAIQKLNAFKNLGHLKLCPLIKSFEELQIGYNWQQQDTENRSFLPRSENGRWLWFRELCYYFQRINFARNFTQMADQPTIYQILTLPEEKPNVWAAVLGTPIHFSRSCVQHEDFFKKYNTFFTAVDISKDEFKKYFSWLVQLGLSYVAVTAPLKEQAFEICQTTSKQALGLKSVNTILVKNNKYFGENTDSDGFVSLVDEFILKDHLKIVIWGGGGTLQLMKSIFPSATCFSSQTGSERDHYATDIHEVDLFIWAAPRSKNTKLPSEKWKIKQIIDLNYVENSLGLELAQKRNIKYTSGIKMFEMQAKKQQEFWSQS